MEAIAVITRSTIGKKVIMGVTGLLLVGFVVSHLAGNLLIFAGQEALDSYSHFLQSGTHGLVWILRATLLAAVVLHIWSAIGLTKVNHDARAVPYAGSKKNPTTTYAALTMRYGWVVILLFIIYHLLHFTFGSVHPDFTPGDVYNNVVTGFSVPWVSGVYVLAMLALGAHLYHGTWSGLQTLGLAHPQFNDGRRQMALGLAVVVVIGNCAIPLACLTGLLEVSP